MGITHTGGSIALVFNNRGAGVEINSLFPGSGGFNRREEADGIS